MLKRIPPIAISKYAVIVTVFAVSISSALAGGGGLLVWTASIIPPTAIKTPPTYPTFFISLTSNSDKVLGVNVLSEQSI